MKRPRSWLRVVLMLAVLLAAGQYLVLTRLVPRYVLWAVQYAAGGELEVESARLSLPLTTTLTRLRLFTNTPQAAFTLQRAVIKPRWLSLPSKTLWLETVELHRPVLRLTRTRDGVLVWLHLPESVTTGRLPSGRSSSSIVAARMPSSWRVQIDSIKIVDGAIELMDEKPSTPFHGLLDHVNIEIGSVAFPLSGSRQINFAGRGELIGDGGHSTLVYGSGWLDAVARDLQASCRMDSLALAAFEPYFTGPPEVRVYATTLTSTSQWSARANELTGRIQLELGHLTEGDLSIRGRSILDIQRVAAGTDPRLTGEIKLAGPLDQPRQWRAEFLAGDKPMQQLVKRLLSRGVEIIHLALWGTGMRVSLVPASTAMITDMQAVEKEIREALEILALPVMDAVPPVQPPAAKDAAVPPSAAEQAQPAPSEPSAEPEPPAPDPAAPSSSPVASPSTIR